MHGGGNCGNALPHALWTDPNSIAPRSGGPARGAQKKSVATGHCAMPRSMAGLPGCRRKSPVAGATNIGSALRLPLPLAVRMIELNTYCCTVSASGSPLFQKMLFITTTSASTLPVVVTSLAWMVNGVITPSIVLCAIRTCSTRLLSAPSVPPTIENPTG